MQEIVVSNVISWLISVVTKFNTIGKIHKYKVLHEGHDFILMAMEVDDTPECDMDHFINECARFFPR
jgi:hypothetical protein